MVKEFTHIFWMLSEEEIDLVNVLLHIIAKHDDILAPPEVGVELELNRCITTNMHDISASLGNTELNIQNILTMLDHLTKNVATIYYNITDGKQQEKATFLNKYAITSVKNDINKRITLWVNSDIVNILQEHKYLFEAFYKHAKFELKSRYAKMIYDYFVNKGHNTQIFTIDSFAGLMEHDLISSKWDWSRLNSNILKRASKEINDKTDMHFNYNKVKTSAGGRVQTTQLEISTYVSKDDEEDGIFEYFDNDVLLRRKVDYYIEKYVLDKFETVTRFKDKGAINDPVSYIAKMRRDAMRERPEFEAKIQVQEWSNVIKYENTEEVGLVGLINYKKHAFVTINNDYKLYDPSTCEELSTSARDTLTKINEYFDEDNEGYSIHPFPGIKNCSISYSKG